MSETPHTSDQGPPDPLASYKRGLANDIAAGKLSTEEIEAAMRSLGAPGKVKVEVSSDDRSVILDAETAAMTYELLDPSTSFERLQEIDAKAKDPTRTPKPNTP